MQTKKFSLIDLDLECFAEKKVYQKLQRVTWFLAKRDLKYEKRIITCIYEDTILN